MTVMLHVYLGVLLAGLTMRACEIAYSAWFRRKWQKELATASRDFNDKMGQLIDRMDAEQAPRPISIDVGAARQVLEAEAELRQAAGRRGSN